MTKFSSPFAAKVTGTGSAFPKRVVTNADIAHDLAKIGEETSHEWVVERTGIHTRRIAEPGNPAEFNSSLGHQAAVRALEMAGKRAEDIDQILYATCSPDTPMPSTACWLQSKLGAKNAWATDLNSACSGFVYALSMADQFIRTGHAKTILVVGGEVLSGITNWTDRGSCIIFGDGAGAAIVERAPADSESRIIDTRLLSDGSLWELLYIRSGGTSSKLTPERIAAHEDRMVMRGREIFKIAVRTLTEFAEKVVTENGFKVEDVDWFIPHQANLRIIEAVSKKLNFPMSKTLVNIDRYGNTSSATVPTALDEAVRAGRIKPGDLILMDVFGAGLTYGSALVRW